MAYITKPNLMVKACYYLLTLFKACQFAKQCKEFEDHYIMTDIYEEYDDYFRNDKENKNSNVMLRSWVQIPPGPFLSVRELRY